MNSYDAWKTRSDMDDDRTRGGIEEPCEKCGQKRGVYLMPKYPAGILVCAECAEEMDARLCCAEAEEIAWCEECDKPKLDCICVDGKVRGLSLIYDCGLNGRFVVVDDLPDPGWIELAIEDPQSHSISGFRLAVHESQIQKFPSG